MGMDEKNERNERRRMGVMGVDRNGWELWEWMGAMRTDGHAGRAARDKKTILGTDVLWMVLFFALKAVGLLLTLSS